MALHVPWPWDHWHSTASRVLFSPQAPFWRLTCAFPQLSLIFTPSPPQSKTCPFLVCFLPFSTPFWGILVRLTVVTSSLNRCAATVKKGVFWGEKLISGAQFPHRRSKNTRRSTFSHFFVVTSSPVDERTVCEKFIVWHISIQLPNPSVAAFAGSCL